MPQKWGLLHDWGGCSMPLFVALKERITLTGYFDCGGCGHRVHWSQACLQELPQMLFGLKVLCGCDGGSHEDR